MSAVGSGELDGQHLGRGVFTIDSDRSAISFRTRAILGLLGVRGTFDVDSGTITVADPVEQSTAEATVSAASFASGIAKRDEHVRSKDHLDAERYPRIVFVGESFEFSDGCGTLHGRLTVKETTQQVRLHVPAVSGDERNLTARATTTIDRFAFGIRTAPGMTGRTLHLDLDLVATR